MLLYFFIIYLLSIETQVIFLKKMFLNPQKVKNKIPVTFAKVGNLYELIIVKDVKGVFFVWIITVILLTIALAIKIKSLIFFF